MLRITKSCLCFLWNLKNAGKIFENSWTLFCYCFILYKEKMLTDIEPQFKVKIEDGREAPLNPVKLNFQNWDKENVWFMFIFYLC